MTTKSLKPFAELSDLVERLRALGMEIPDPETAVSYLGRVGYHRSGGYRYVFREMLPPTEQDPRARKFRADSYVPGTSFDEVSALEEWDGKLRLITLQGCFDLEIRLRAAIAHVMAARDPYGYQLRSKLEERVCVQKSGAGTKLDAWRETVEEACRKASSEDFVIHHRQTYPGAALPIWALVDILNIGALPYFLDLMITSDGNDVARRFGARNGKTLSTWVRAVADLRNVCAHHSRLFNRSMKRSIRVTSRDVDPSGHLGHLLNFQPSTPDPGKKLYPILAVVAHMLRSQDECIQWPRTLSTHLKKFPNRQFQDPHMPDLSLLASCGFPKEWLELPLWTYK